MDTFTRSPSTKLSFGRLLFARASWAAFTYKTGLQMQHHLCRIPFRWCLSLPRERLVPQPLVGLRVDDDGVAVRDELTSECPCGQSNIGRRLRRQILIMEAGCQLPIGGRLQMDAAGSVGELSEAWSVEMPRGRSLVVQLRLLVLLRPRCVLHALLVSVAKQSRQVVLPCCGTLLIPCSSFLGQLDSLVAGVELSGVRAAASRDARTQFEGLRYPGRRSSSHQRRPNDNGPSCLASRRWAAKGCMVLHVPHNRVVVDGGIGVARIVPHSTGTVVVSSEVRTRLSRDSPVTREASTVWRGD